MNAPPGNDADSILHQLGREFFPSLDTEAFIELLFQAASHGFTKGTVRLRDPVDLPDDLEIPDAFVQRHIKKLKFWSAFELLNTENPIADTTSMGAIYHPELQCGVTVVYSDAGGTCFHQPFAFASGRFPEKEIVKTLLAQIETEGVPLCGELTNYIPALCPRRRLQKAYRHATLELVDDEEEYNSLFTEAYTEETR